MKDFDDLVHVMDRLLAPDGCPWDREQTLQTLRQFLVEEVYEIIEAIDLNDHHLLSEEIGDVFFQLVFLCKLAERDKLFTLNESLQLITQKMILRHPHIFEKAEDKSVQEVLDQWEEIKKKEKSHRTSIMDDIPKGLPALSRAQKMLGKFKKAGFDWKEKCFQDNVEDAFGLRLLELVKEGSEEGINAEVALLKQLSHLERQFRDMEAN